MTEIPLTSDRVAVELGPTYPLQEVDGIFIWNNLPYREIRDGDVMPDTQIIELVWNVLGRLPSDTTVLMGYTLEEIRAFGAGTIAQNALIEIFTSATQQVRVFIPDPK